MKRTAAGLTLVCLLVCSSRPASGQAVSADSNSETIKKLKDRLELLEARLDLSKKENELLKKENELLKKEVESLKKNGKGRSIEDRTTLARVTAGGVKYELAKVERSGARVNLTLMALSEDKDQSLNWFFVTTTDDKGNTQRHQPWGGFVGKLVNLREGVKQKVEVQLTGIPLKAKQLSITVEGLATFTFRNVPLD